MEQIETSQKWTSAENHTHRGSKFPVPIHIKCYRPKYYCGPNDWIYEWTLRVQIINSLLSRWKKASGDLLTDDNGHADDSWIGVMANCVWLLSQHDDHLLYKVLGEIPYPDKSQFDSVRFKVVAPKKRAKSKCTDGRLYDAAHYDNLLRRYFRLDVDLDECYAKWAGAHEHFKNEAAQFYAVRVLDQDPVENLFSFICSQNNHISR